ncbi:MAG: CHAT domain-containing protein [Limisphaerales bacterium]
MGTDGSARTASILAAEQLALNKALLEEIQITQAALDADPRSVTESLRQEYGTALARKARLSGKELDPTHRLDERGELEGELSRLEHQLAECAALVAQTIAERDLTLTNVARRVPPDGVLLDFVQYRRLDFLRMTNCWREQRYAAYLTFPVAEESTSVVVERVDLGAAAPINEAVGFICARMSEGHGYTAADLLAAVQRVSDLVYAPLAKYLANVSHLIVCPDGQLSRLPFEMLSHGGRFVIEDKTISYVGSGREIVRLAGGPESKVRSSKSLVMGNPDFDLDFSNVGAAVDLARKSETNADLPKLSGPALASTLSRDYRGKKFPPLPGAEAEARSVAKLLGAHTVLKIGADAREAALKAVVSPRVLHLATHGFFLSDQEFRRTNGIYNGFVADGGLAGWRTRPGEDWENPLVRCGIALAGANHASQLTNALAEDGLLTGLEAALLNLQGTELVILSACNSGTGDVKIGEGVMSLRRAFRIAGAETVLASHWQVSDKATGLLMTEFMRRWRSGEPRAKAWREAQLSLLHSKDFSNPYFWASFTLTGQWR